MDKTVEMNANELVAYFRKPATELTKADIIAFVREKGIRMVDFMYPAEDGRVKTLNFMINNLAYLETILTDGERSPTYPRCACSARSSTRTGVPSTVRPSRRCTARPLRSPRPRA